MLGENHFTPTPSIPARLRLRNGDQIRATAKNLLSKGSVITPDDVAALVARFGLDDAEELLLHLLPLATTIAQPPISDFHVGATGLASNGAIVLGGNLEWPDAHLGMTLHGEGFVAIRAFQLGLSLTHVAVSQARPCGHCRQCLAEFATASDLLVIDPLGHRLKLSDLFPWAFTPQDLEMTGADPAARNEITLHGAPAIVATPLTHAVRHSHAPYSGVNAAVAFEADSQVVTGGVIESVAFNPTIQPVMSALVELVAHGIAPAQIERAWLAQMSGPVDYTASTKALLATFGTAPLSVIQTTL